MGGRECCVNNCGSSSHDHQGRMLLNGLSFHCFPAWRTKEGDFISELTRRRRDAWVTAVGRREITFDHVPSSMRVCSRHFLSGESKQVLFLCSTRRKRIQRHISINANHNTAAILVRATRFLMPYKFIFKSLGFILEKMCVWGHYNLLFNANKN